MGNDEADLYSFFEALTHPIRLKIITFLYENETLTYTQLLEFLKIDTGKLNFHFKKLGDLIEKTKEGKYRLSKKGWLAVSTIKAVREHLGVKEIREHTKSYFFRRFLAWLIDIFIIYIVAIGDIDLSMYDYSLPYLYISISLPAILIKPLIYIFSFNIFALTTPEQIVGVYYKSILWIYWTLLEGYRGQSIGKMVLGIKIIKTDMSLIQLADSAVSSFGKAFILPIDILAGMILKIIKKGYFIRFTEYYTRIMTIPTSLKP
ncbi:MAG: RDD family protein [Candidatus Asgardarchaeia archaeon]|nr:RDD family protein [Candidatus Odinarchaeota archaeon]